MENYGAFSNVLQLKGETKVKQVVKKLTLMSVAIFLFWAGKGTTFAAEELQVTKEGVYEVSEETPLKEDSKETAKTISTLEAGTVVVVNDYGEGEWCQVSIGELTGYVKISDLQITGDVEALNEEFKGIKQDYENLYEEIMEMQRQQRISKIWGTVIVLLVVIIFAVGILSGIKKNKEEKRGNENETDHPDTML